MYKVLPGKDSLRLPGWFYCQGWNHLPSPCINSSAQIFDQTQVGIIFVEVFAELQDYGILQELQIQVCTL